jgi:Bacterial archaeo-eukaryotic release factor family 10
MTTQDQLDRIIGFDSGGLPVVSVYVRVTPDDALSGDGDVQTRVNSLLDPIRALSRDRTLGHAARLSVRGDLDRIVAAARQERWAPGTMALFACSGRAFFEEVSLPRFVRDEAVVDDLPWVRLMLAVLDDYQRMCVVVTDDASARFWELHLREIREIQQLRDPALRKPDYAAGMLEYTVHNKAGELAKRHYRRVAVLVDEIHRTGGFDLLAVGGHEYELSTVVAFLPRHLRDRLAGTMSIDAGTATSADVRRGAEEIMERYERERARALVAGILEAVAERRLAAVGVEPCLWAGSMSAIEELAVEDGPVAPGVFCGRDAWMALSGEVCPLCGEPLRPTRDVLNRLVQAVIAASGRVTHVRAETALRRHTVGAHLRFPVPAPAA